MSHRDDDDDDVLPTGTYERYGGDSAQPSAPMQLDLLKREDSPPFEELASHYLTSLMAVDARKQSRKNDAGHLRAALAWMRERGIARPITVDWKAYFDWRLSIACPDKVTPSTIESHRQAVRKVYTRCAEMPKQGWREQGWFLIPNPVSTAFLAPYYKPQLDSRPRAMDNPDATYPRLYAAMPDPLARGLIETLFNQGLRIQEALAIPLPGGALEEKLGRRFLNLEERTLTVDYQRERDCSEVGPLKTGFSRATLKLVKPTVEAMREAIAWRKQQDMREDKHNRLRQGWAGRAYLFPYFRKDLERLMKIHRTVAPLDFRKRVKGEHGGDAWHVYRHTYATDLARQGISKQEIHDLLRHREMKTTDAYLRALLAEVRGSDAVEEAARRRKERQQQAVAQENKADNVLPMTRKGTGDKK